MKHGRVSAGHPVDVASGTQFTAWEDIEIPGIVPLLWRRYYSTAQIGKTSEVFGRGWSAYFEMTLSRDLEGYRFTGPDGEVVFFDDVSGSVETGGSALSPGDSLELRREGQLYVIEERIIRNREARILSDGTVEAETDEGWMRFENLEHLNEYLDATETVARA